LEVAGASEYLMRNYESAAAPDTDWFSVYVGYYERQTQGKTIHSPKNCLPGGGWEPLASRTEEIETAIGRVRVNRYLLQRGTEQALVLYWYQGRGRVEANEYLVKWDLLRDAVMRQRTEEALVRVVVPVNGNEAGAFDLAARAAADLIPFLQAALPG
jgi:EpsI family protein